MGALTLIASFAGVNEIIALLLTGALGTIYFYLKSESGGNLKSFLPFLFINIGSASAHHLTTMKVFWTFLKVGAVLYGSGYVLFAYLDAELVTRGWLTRQELLDAIAIGQFTPGPVLSTATFIGYQLTGFWGAVAATAGIFLPSFIFVLILNPFVPKMRNSKIVSYFLDSVNIAAVAVMIAVLVMMSMETLLDWVSITIALISLILTFGKKKVGPMWIIGGGAILGYVLNLI